MRQLPAYERNSFATSLETCILRCGKQQDRPFVVPEDTVFYPEGPAFLQLDWTRRFDHMQQHTGQHLLTAVAQDQFKWGTTAFHLGAQVCDIELDAPSISPADMDRLEEAVAAEIRVHHEISARWVGPEAYGLEPVRSRGLPDGHTG
jgi:hypothetical protein